MCLPGTIVIAYLPAVSRWWSIGQHPDISSWRSRVRISSWSINFTCQPHVGRTPFLKLTSTIVSLIKRVNNKGKDRMVVNTILKNARFLKSLSLQNWVGCLPPKISIRSVNLSAYSVLGHWIIFSSNLKNYSKPTHISVHSDFCVSLQGFLNQKQHQQSREILRGVQLVGGRERFNQ